MWSFGILLEELALGRAPYANMSLTSVILTTLHQDAPTLAIQKTKRKFSEVRALPMCIFWGRRFACRVQEVTGRSSSKPACEPASGSFLNPSAQHISQLDLGDTPN